MIAALKAGYRHIDTALAYGNEAEVGEGIKVSSTMHLNKRRTNICLAKLTTGLGRAQRRNLDHHKARQHLASCRRGRHHFVLEVARHGLCRSLLDALAILNRSERHEEASARLGLHQDLG